MTGAPVQEEGLLDDIIERLLDIRNSRPGKQVNLTEHEMRQLCLTSKEIFMSQPNLLELEAPIKICGAPFGPAPCCMRPRAPCGAAGGERAAARAPASPRAP